MSGHASSQAAAAAAAAAASIGAKSVSPAVVRRQRALGGQSLRNDPAAATIVASLSLSLSLCHLSHLGVYQPGQTAPPC